MTIRDLFNQLSEWYYTDIIIKWIDDDLREHELDIDEAWDCELRFLYSKGGLVHIEVDKPDEWEEETEEEEEP